jgi:ParB family chromosome partitioning protein
MKKKKGLGTGLGALFGDAAMDDVTSSDVIDAILAESSIAQSDFEFIPTRRIEPSSSQPRTTFEQEKIDALSESIREHGILSPILVRRLDSGYYRIIAGERRWRAAREVGLSEMPVRILSTDDKNALELALVENLQRENLNPIEEARGFKALLEEFDMTQEEVGQRVGKSRPAITNMLRLLSLPTELIELVESGKLQSGGARALMGLKNKDKDNLLEAAQMVVDKDMSVREVESIVKSINQKAALKEKDDVNVVEKNGSLEVDYNLDAQNRLTTALGRRVSIRRNRSKGAVEIEFYGKDDFDALFDALIDFGVSKMGGSDRA